MGYKWVTKNRSFAVNQTIFPALLPNTFSKQPAKKPQGPATLLKSTHLVLRIRSADCRWAFAGRGPWTMFLGNVFCLEHMFLFGAYAWVVTKLIKVIGSRCIMFVFNAQDSLHLSIFPHSVVFFSIWKPYFHKTVWL